MNGVIDVGVVWGPLGGYIAKQYADKLTMVPLLEEEEGTLKITYRMTMGVRPDCRRFLRNRWFGSRLTRDIHESRGAEGNKGEGNKGVRGE